MKSRMLSFLGCFACFRKMKLTCALLAGTVPLIVGAALLMAGAALLAASPSAAQATERLRIADDEPGRPYIGRDFQGGRLFGTNDKSDGGFLTDPDTGDRRFQTRTPKQQQQDQGWSGGIYVYPQMDPNWLNGGGRPPHWGGNRPPWGGGHGPYPRPMPFGR